MRAPERTAAPQRRRLLHRPFDHRRDTGATWPDQGCCVPPRPDRRGHAARVACARIPGRQRSGTMIASAADTLTHVELIWIEKRIEHWIRFGRDVAEQILDRRRRVFSFAPNSILRVRSMGGKRFWNRRLSHRHFARRLHRRKLLDRAVSAARWRDSAAHRRLAKCRARVAIHRRR